MARAQKTSQDDLGKTTREGRPTFQPNIVALPPSKRVELKVLILLSQSHPTTDWLMMVSILHTLFWYALTTYFCFGAYVACGAQELSREDFFESRVRPLLISKCLECHGPETQWGELRVDSLPALLKGGEHGPAITIGQPNASLLIAAVEQTGDLKMPPDDNPPLNATEISTLRKWIEDGAYWTANDAAATAEQEKQRKWKNHWAFQPLKVVPPPIVDPQDSLTPIDAFVSKTLQQNGLHFSPTADRRTLIRRLYFDLIGIPPTPQQVSDFESDQDPGAYAKVVDRLLESQAYGEHWGRLWLDVARYSDTKGYVYGREEKNFIHAYVYRDWVSRAFKEDLPYDRFLQLQLAADQLTPSGHHDRAAMGFLTLGRRFLGVSHDIIDDRIDTVSRGLMAITVSCARCHDHKYDPVPTADYYALYGVFLNSSEQIERLSLPAESQRDATTKLPENWEAELTKRQTALDQKMKQSREEASQRMRSRIKDYFIAQSELDKYPQEGFDQILATSDLIPNLVRRLEMLLTATQINSDRRFAAWHKFAAIPKSEFADSSDKVTEELQQLSDHELHPRVKQLFTSPPTSFREVAERYGQLFADIEAQWSNQQRQIDSNNTSLPSAMPNSEDEELRQFLYNENSPCLIPNEHISSIEGLFDSNTCTELWRLQGDVDRWIMQPGVTTPFTTLLVDRKTDYPARILKRGNPAQKGSMVHRHQLSLLDPTQTIYANGSGRLTLAQSITSTNNPLTARVWVNRVWKQHFGSGLVRTPSDFGMRAEPPSHPELLDWLADQFMKNGWSNKQLHRWIVMSRVYQQASSPDLPADYLQHANQIDPDNRLLWRYTPRRLSFEMMRDAWLSIAGELDPTFGGRAGELFAAANKPQRRTLYASIDRQFVPGVLRMFDYANPDMHAPQRSETTVPQQALFSLNHPFIADRAKALIRRLDTSTESTDLNSRVQWLFQAVLQRSPTQAESDALTQFLNAPEDSAQSVPDSVKAWSYGYGEFEAGGAQPLKSFHVLPFFNGSSWQGSTIFPDATLGWVRLTADGGHPGNDLQHVAVRRWTSPIQGVVHLRSMMEHQEAVGDGVRCTIISNRHGVLATELVHNKKWDFERDSITVEVGDTLDFVTDIYQVLNTDQYLWQLELSANNDTNFTNWNSLQDFHGPPSSRLNRWEEAAQILLISNELLFVE